jgi:VWFA-related protein
VYDLLSNLEQVHNRRKALVYVSDGYDFNPFQDARLGLMDANSPFAQNDIARSQNQMRQSSDDGSSSNANDPLTSHQKQNEVFADADLARELGELTRQANRANVTVYTIDPRGLVGMGDIDEQVDPQQWNEYVRKSQDSLRVIAEETGGIAVVNQNDFSKALKRIDAETSDYYVLGYYSKNPDATKRRRVIDVKVTRKNAQVWFRKEYVLKPNPKPVDSTKK